MRSGFNLLHPQGVINQLTHTHTYAYTPAHNHTRTHARTGTDTHILLIYRYCSHTHTHMHSHTHILTQKYTLTTDSGILIKICLFWITAPSVAEIESFMVYCVSIKLWHVETKSFEANLQFFPHPSLIHLFNLL